MNDYLLRLFDASAKTTPKMLKITILIMTDITTPQIKETPTNRYAINLPVIGASKIPTMAPIIAYIIVFFIYLFFDN